MENVITTTKNNTMTVERFNEIKFLKIRIVSDDLAMATNNMATAITQKKKIKYANQLANVIFDIAKAETWEEFDTQCKLYLEYQKELHSKKVAQ